MGQHTSSKNKNKHIIDDINVDTKLKANDNNDNGVGLTDNAVLKVQTLAPHTMSTASPSPSMYKIQISYRGRMTPLSVSGNDTINYVKQHFADVEGLSLNLDFIHLRHLGKRLNGNKRLTELGITAGSILHSSFTCIYKLAKKIYKKQGKPVIIDTCNALDDIKTNANNYKNVALPLTLGRDKAFNQWNEQQFKNEFSSKFNIPIQCINVISVKAGSQIIDLKLETHSSGNKLLIPIECIAENISISKAKKELVEAGIFVMEFGLPEAGFTSLKQRVIMNPKWNREYGLNYTHWNGALNDGKSRGNEPYYCPNGWKRFSVQFSTTAYDFKNVYDKWPIAYHGTKFQFGMLITLSGLKATGGDHGQGVYLSPSIRYVSHHRYCEPIKLDLSKAAQMKWTSEYVNEFKKYDGKWIQVAFACRVKPGSFIKGKQTMGAWLPNDLIKNGKFDNLDVNTIEWLVKEASGNIVLSDRILIYGIMIKASDTKPNGY